MQDNAERVAVDLEERIESFKSVKLPHKPFKYRACYIYELADPYVADRCCARASSAFYDHLRQALPNVTGSSGMKKFPPDFGITILYVRWHGHGDDTHWVVVANGSVVDWTARQYDPTVAWPLVEPLRVYLERCEWVEDLHHQGEPFDPQQFDGKE